MLGYGPSGSEPGVFRFPGPVEYGFALKGSPAPLALAFFDENGTILKLEMLPLLPSGEALASCAQQCTGDDPGVPFQGMLVDAGDRLARAGV